MELPSSPSLGHSRWVRSPVDRETALSEIPTGAPTVNSTQQSIRLCLSRRPRRPKTPRCHRAEPIHQATRRFGVSKRRTAGDSFRSPAVRHVRFVSDDRVIRPRRIGSARPDYANTLAKIASTWARC